MQRMPIKAGALLMALSTAGCVQTPYRRLYDPTPIATTPVAAAWSGRAPVLVAVTAADGGVLHGWFWKPTDPTGDIVVFLPGRSGNRDIAARRAQALAAGGRGLLVASYRGFGDNPGSPDEAGLNRDGAAFIAFARAHASGAKLYLFGDGLGAAVALEEAGHVPVDGVVTLGAFTRLRDYAPPATRALYTDAFDNVRAIAQVSTTVVLMHGIHDEVVPFASAATLAKASRGHAIVAPIAGNAHHSVDVGFLAPIVWQALDRIGRHRGGGAQPAS